jgi:hypothetical protein
MVHQDDQSNLGEFTISYGNDAKSIKCALELPNKNTRWPAIAEIKFKEFVAQRQMFQVKLVEPNDSRFLVDLVFDEQKMSLMTMLRNYCSEQAIAEINQMVERFNGNIDNYFKGLVKVVSFITLQNFFITYKASECLVTEIGK